MCSCQLKKKKGTNIQLFFNPKSSRCHSDSAISLLGSYLTDRLKNYKQFKCPSTEELKMEYYKGINNNELDFYVLIWKKKSRHCEFKKTSGIQKQEANNV